MKCCNAFNNGCPEPSHIGVKLMFRVLSLSSKVQISGCICTSFYKYGQVSLNPVLHVPFKSTKSQRLSLFLYICISKCVVSQLSVFQQFPIFLVEKNVISAPGKIIVCPHITYSTCNSYYIFIRRQL